MFWLFETLVLTYSQIMGLMVVVVAAAVVDSEMMPVVEEGMKSMMPVQTMIVVLAEQIPFLLAASRPERLQRLPP